MSDFWSGFVGGIIGAIIGGVMIMFLNYYLIRPKLRLSVSNDFPVGTHTKSVGIVVENCAINLPFIERNVARKLSILYRVSSAIKRSWFFGGSSFSLMAKTCAEIARSFAASQYSDKD